MPYAGVMPLLRLIRKFFTFHSEAGVRIFLVKIPSGKHSKHFTTSDTKHKQKTRLNAQSLRLRDDCTSSILKRQLSVLIPCVEETMTD